MAALHPTPQTLARRQQRGQKKEEGTKRKREGRRKGKKEGRKEGRKEEGREMGRGHLAHAPHPASQTLGAAPLSRVKQFTQFYAGLLLQTRDVNV